MSEAKLRDIDVASSLRVDPKTVQRWLSGRLPQSRHRWALADLLGVSEVHLWPEVIGGGLIAPEVRATYSYRSSVPRDVWLQLFDRAEDEIAVLVYSGLFIAEDVKLVRLMGRKAAQGVSVRLLLGDPDSSQVSQRGVEEGIADAMAAKIRNAIVLYGPLLDSGDVDLRLHSTVLYNSLYRSDDDLLVNQHVFGVAAANAPVMHLRRDGESEMFATYLASFDRVWAGARPIREANYV